MSVWEFLKFMKQVGDLLLSLVLNSSVFRGLGTILLQIHLSANIYKYLPQLLPCVLKASSDKGHDLLRKNLQICLS